MKKVVKKAGPKNVSDVEPISEIDKGLFLGSQEAARRGEILDAHGIKNVLQLVEVPPVISLESRINFLKLPIRGGKNTDIQPILQQSLRFIFNSVSTDQNILVHCKWGKNRSASIMIAFIMASKSLTFFEAERFVRSKRSIIQIKDQTKDLLNRLGYRGLQNLIQ